MANDWAAGLADGVENFFTAADRARKRKQEDQAIEAEAEIARSYGKSLGNLGGSAPAPVASATSGLATDGSTGGSAAPKLPTFAQGDAIGQYANAISGIESGGRYDIVGPTHKKLGRALGKYQVMEANVGPWSREALGREVSADEFLRNPEIQDKVFQHRFGQYVQKYGNPQDAASAWFTGRPMAQGANARDSLGTTGRRYVEMFNAGLQRQGGGRAPDLPVTRMAMPALPKGGVQVAETEADTQRLERSTGMTAEADLPASSAQPTQFAVPGEGRAAQTAPLPPAVDATAQRVQQMLQHSNPYVRRHGIALAEKYLTNDRYGFQVVGDRLVRTNARTGTVEAMQGFDKPQAPATVSPGAALVDPRSGREVYRNPRSEKDTLEDVATQRQRLAAEVGLKEGDPAYRSFILTGRMPREDQQPLSASDKKAILESDDAIVSAQTVIENLGKAKELSKTAYEGFAAGPRGYVASLVGGKAGEDTTELDKIVTGTALTQLKAIFGGNPTEGERKILLEIQGSSSQPDAVRQKIYDRAKALAERRLNVMRERANELRGGTYYKPGGGNADGASSSPDKEAPQAPAGTTKSGVSWKVIP